MQQVSTIICLPAKLSELQACITRAESQQSNNLTRNTRIHNNTKHTVNPVNLLYYCTLVQPVTLIAIIFTVYRINRPATP
jgi:hypothetical protein